MVVSARGSGQGTDGTCYSVYSVYVLFRNFFSDLIIWNQCLMVPPGALADERVPPFQSFPATS